MKKIQESRAFTLGNEKLSFGVQAPACFRSRYADKLKLELQTRGVRRFSLLASIVLLSCACVCAEEARHEKTFRNLSVSVPLLKQAPTLDGTVDPAEWAGAGMMPRMVGFEREDRLMDEHEKFYFAYTDDALMGGHERYGGVPALRGDAGLVRSLRRRLEIRRMTP